MKNESNVMKKEISLILAIIIVVVVGAGAFYGGAAFQRTKNVKARGNFQIGNRMGQVKQNGQNQLTPINGEVISQDDKSVTVKLNNGSTRNIIISDSTTISKSENGAKFDIKDGDQVMVFGKANSDGSLTALNLQINPIKK